MSDEVERLCPECNGAVALSKRARFCSGRCNNAFHNRARARRRRLALLEDAAQTAPRPIANENEDKPDARA